MALPFVGQQGWCSCNQLAIGKSSDLLLVLQTLGDQFRNDYSQLWYSMINRDLDGIKKYSTKLGAGDLHHLLACMLAAKPWSAVSGGLTKVRDEASQLRDKQALKKFVQEYFPNIARVLDRVPREMLLILKTNDLLRGIETSLGTKDQRTSLVTMSRYCVRAIYAEQRKHSKWFVNRLRLTISEQWVLCKLFAFQLYLGVTAMIYGARYL